MITYFYWGCVIVLVMLAMFLIGGKLANWKMAFGAAAIILLAGWGAYYFHFQQIFVKRYGGVMSVTVPDGLQHIAATWKDENLWIENYDPEKNTCYFEEYSKRNMLEGRVSIKNCNPIALANGAAARNSTPAFRQEATPAPAASPPQSPPATTYQ
jgi:hypothetical protein